MHFRITCFLMVQFFIGTNLFGQSGPITIGAGKFSDVVVTSSSESNATKADNTVQESGFLPNLTATSRFLGQSTLGANYETIVSASQKGEEKWLEEQFALQPEFLLEDYVKELTRWAADSILTQGGDVSNVQPQRYYWHFSWWKYVMTTQDLLRSRVALALSEIMVISELPQLRDVPLSLANYYDMLMRNSFGNFRDSS